MRPSPKLGEAPTLGMMRPELPELVRREGKMLGDIRASLDRIDCHFDGMEISLCGLHRDIDGFSQDVDCFRRDLSRTVRKAVCEAFRKACKR